MQTDGAPRVPKKTYYGRTAKKGALWSFFRQSGNELVGIPTSIILARLLTPTDFGIAAAASFFVLLAARLSQLGLNAAIARTKELRPEHLSSVFVVSLAMGTTIYALLALAAPLIGQFFRSPEAGALLPLAALTFVINPFGTVASALLFRRMEFRHSTLADWTDTIVGSAVTLIFAFRGYGAYSIVYGHVAAPIVRVILQIYLARWIPRFTFSWDALRELIRFGLGVQAKRTLEYASLNLDNLVVGRMLGVTALGFYDKAFMTMNRLVTRLTLGPAPFRIFSIIHEDTDRFRRAYSRLILSVTLVGFPPLAAGIVAAGPLITLLYGEQWLPAVVPFQFLCASGMLRLLNSYASQANEAAGNIWPQVRRQAVGVVLIVVGAAVGCASGGIAGAALGVSIAMLFFTAAMQALVRRAVGLSWGEMIAPQVPASVCAGLLAALLLAVDHLMRVMISEPSAWQLLLAEATVGTAFYLAFLLYGPFPHVRELVMETVDDLLPARALQMLGRPAGLAPGQ